MATRTTGRRRLLPLASILALGAVGLAVPAMAADTTPAPLDTAISAVTSNLTIGTPTAPSANAPKEVGVQNDLSATLLDSKGFPVVGASLVFATRGSQFSGPQPLCTATTNDKGVGACVAFVGLDPMKISTVGVSQIADIGKFTVYFTGTTSYLKSDGAGVSTFYKSPPPPVIAAR